MSSAGAPIAAAVARGLEGFVRSLAKELGRRGVTVNQASVTGDALARLDAVVRFFCGPQCAYVSGQSVHVLAETAAPASVPFTSALAGKVALVTGAAGGIGLATAERLAQEGAKVVALDIPALGAELDAIASRLGGAGLALDLAAADTPVRLARFLRENFGGVDIVVHNAGITRDRTLAKMEQRQWDQVLDINLAAIAAIDTQLQEEALLRDHGRVVCLSSISGIAGNFGQTNYATSKAALIAYVAAQAPLHAARGITFNAVAPGFIETAMTKKVPFLTREIGRRLNSLSQGGQPRDVAELVTFLATPGACGISGQTIRVCGQGLMGA
jgi:3-oxoacyl-[acyl-carrier protein] reductase